MAWYRTGTVAVTNGSTTVTGTGTAFVGAAAVGDAIHLPDGKVYEVAVVVSNTALTITPGYMGATASGQAYAVQPTRAWTKPLLDKIDTWLAGQQGFVDGPLAGKFGDGTALLPGLAFAADVDTGIARLAANVLGLIAGGAERARVTAAGMQLTGLLTGTAVQQAVDDTTAGRLLAVGAYGLGDPAATGTSLTAAGAVDALRGWRVDRVLSANALTVGLPAAVGAAVMTIGWGPSNQAQLVFEISGTGRVWARYLNAGTWSGWRLAYTQATILGTVSQTAGVPTGAVIEAGSNANGEYTRWADGTQMCWSPIFTGDPSTALGSIFRLAAAGTWTLPAAFANANYAVAPCPNNNVQTHWANARSVTTTSVEYQILAPTSQTGRSIRIMASGRWF